MSVENERVGKLPIYKRIDCVFACAHDCIQRGYLRLDPGDVIEESTDLSLA